MFLLVYVCGAYVLYQYTWHAIYYCYISIRNIFTTAAVVCVS